MAETTQQNYNNIHLAQRNDKNNNIYGHENENIRVVAWVIVQGNSPSPVYFDPWLHNVKELARASQVCSSYTKLSHHREVRSTLQDVCSLPQNASSSSCRRHWRPPWRHVGGVRWRIVSGQPMKLRAAGCGSTDHVGQLRRLLPARGGQRPPCSIETPWRETGRVTGTLLNTVEIIWLGECESKQRKKKTATGIWRIFTSDDSTSVNSRCSSPV